MASCDRPVVASVGGVAEAPMLDELHHLKELVSANPAFAEALRAADTTEEVAELARKHGIAVTAEALWRNRGTLVQGGQPTWRG